MTDYERKVLDHYRLPNAYPTEWPIEKDQDDESEDEITTTQPIRNDMVRTRSRYSALERVASDRRSAVPGAQKTDAGRDNLVQKDEADPLGQSDSVLRVLADRGIPVQDDPILRNRFLLSSTTFSPTLFLSQVHATDTSDDLIKGLEVLSRSIDQKSASLKVLVESNFERFVKAKSTIDNVYTEMKLRGEGPQQQRPPHSRHGSRNSFRNSSGPVVSGPVSPTDIRRKNALTKESEYGVLGIKAPLIDVSAKAEEVWGPALGGIEKEETLKTVAASTERYKDSYEAGTVIADCIRLRNHDRLVGEYARARRIVNDARRLANSFTNGQATPTDSQSQQIIIAARMWSDVEEQIEDFKRDLWRQLTALQNLSPEAAHNGQKPHIQMISILLELGTEDNPISVWLQSRYEYLKDKIQTMSDRSKVEIEVQRRRLASNAKPSSQEVVSHFRVGDRQGIDGRTGELDSTDIIDMWERTVSFVGALLSQDGVLGEVIYFWQTVQSFIDGTAQKKLPVGFNGTSRHHHKLSEKGISDFRSGTIELVDMIREGAFSFFADPPIEDISSLYSPLPPTPSTPGIATLSQSSLRDPRFAFDSNNPPPPSPRLGESWEKFAFWPPWSNSISGVHYLAKLLTLVGNGASELAMLAPVATGDGSALERLRSLVSGARERSVTAVCAAWNKDAENVKVLEDWKRSSGKKDLTRMPDNFGAFEDAILVGMQKILYLSEATAKHGSAEIILPPPPKLLQIVRSQFVTTLYKTFSGMVENAERPAAIAEGGRDADVDGLTVPFTSITGAASGSINASDRNVRMLLTLSNLQALRVAVIPNLTAQFENTFAVKLSDETKTIRDVLGQIDARLFQSYTRPAVEQVRGIIRQGILSPAWPPPTDQKPREVKTYIYKALLALVLIHTQVSTTASSLTSQVLSYLLEQICTELLEAFKQRSRYHLASLMQATLDVEFVAQTLSQYTTDRASELQSQIYQELDKGTDNDARLKLQTELPEMRAVLKRLREGSKSEFACFKKARRTAERTQTAQTAQAGGS